MEVESSQEIRSDWSTSKDVSNERFFKKNIFNIYSLIFQAIERQQITRQREWIFKNQWILLQRVNEDRCRGLNKKKYWQVFFLVTVSAHSQHHIRCYIILLISVGEKIIEEFFPELNEENKENQVKRRIKIAWKCCENFGYGIEIKSVLLNSEPIKAIFIRRKDFPLQHKSIHFVWFLFIKAIQRESKDLLIVMLT